MSDQTRSVLNGLFSLAVLVAVLAFAKTAVDKWRSGDAGGSVSTPAAGSTADLDPERVRTFYDAAIRRIEDQCSPTDKRCEARVKKQVAIEHGIAEGQAEGVFIGEALRRGRQGR